MINVWTDGAARPNPGKGGIGVVIRGETWDYTVSLPLPGKVSSNQAEYCALIHALTELIRNNCTDRPIQVYSDSQLMVYQMNGQWQIDRGGNYTEAYQQAVVLARKFSDLSFDWISRKENTEANALASKALKG